MWEKKKPWPLLLHENDAKSEGPVRTGNPSTLGSAQHIAARDIPDQFLISHLVLVLMKRDTESMLRPDYTNRG